MTVDEAIFDEARRYAIALLAEGRDRLRDVHPSVPGPLAAEVFWYIESRLPHLSRCALERLILGEDNAGAGWRRYTVARQRAGDEARYWKSWPQTRQHMALAQDLQDREILERRGHESNGELLEIQPVLPPRSAAGSFEAAENDSLSQPLLKGRVPLELHCKDRLRIYKETPDQFTLLGQQTAADGGNGLADDQITGPLPVDVRCHLSDNSCLSHLDCPHRQVKVLRERADGSPITFGRLLEALYKAEAVIADHNRQCCNHDDDRLAHLLNWQRAALWSQLCVLAAWEGCHRILRKKLLRGERLQVEREDFAREFAEVEQYNLRYFG